MKKQPSNGVLSFITLLITAVLAIVLIRWIYISGNTNTSVKTQKEQYQEKSIEKQMDSIFEQLSVKEDAIKNALNDRTKIIYAKIKNQSTRDDGLAEAEQYNKFLEKLLEKIWKETSEYCSDCKVNINVDDKKNGNIMSKINNNPITK